jgi:hypothetical protein
VRECRCREMPIHYQMSKVLAETKHGFPIKGLRGVSQCAVTKDPVSMCIIETINSLSELSQSIMQAFQRNTINRLTVSLTPFPRRCLQALSLPFFRQARIALMRRVQIRPISRWGRIQAHDSSICTAHIWRDLSETSAGSCELGPQIRGGRFARAGIGSTAKSEEADEG